ncbi:MAG: ribose-phosphate diphosphokinase [Aestuariibacter sp.]|nr:ribose-phosphate diphosphokinase [Aestuariibacter sp.]|tara:strand:+ start:134684 stop:135559 length:876 start_codon:yes stop_codon:yes gene_type:complete
MRIFIKQSGCQEERELQVETITFNGGEENIRIVDDALNELDTETQFSARIETRLTNSSAVMKLLLAVNALRNIFGGTLNLELKALYFPYARQDRVCNEGEALSVRVMADLINSMNFTKVVIADAHSDVTTALLNNVVNLSQVNVINRCTTLTAKLKSNDYTLVAPDAGAAKKTHTLAKYMGCTSVVQGEKLRDMATGDIIRTEINGDVAGKDLIIVDDLCDGGRTYLELAKVAKNRGAQSISLYVTHGIFSQGMSVFAGLIDTIYTTDSFKTREQLQALNGADVSLTVVEL